MHFSNIDKVKRIGYVVGLGLWFLGLYYLDNVLVEIMGQSIFIGTITVSMLDRIQTFVEDSQHTKPSTSERLMLWAKVALVLAFVIWLFYQAFFYYEGSEVGIILLIGSAISFKIIKNLGK